MRPPVDFVKVGYYREGPMPGDPGPAVLAGHVDDTSGPKVFFRLRELRAGDPVVITSVRIASMEPCRWSLLSAW